MRIIYNRASADPDGKPWSERKRYIWWDTDEGTWTGLGDSPDFPATKEPGFKPERDAKGMEAIAGDKPFTLHPDGRGWIYSPTGLVDGPLPAHYEPQETPFTNPLYAQQQNPTRQVFHRPENPYHPFDGESGADVFPFVLDDVSADRASHRRRHVANGPLSGRAPARVLLRGLAAAGRRAWP